MGPNAKDRGSARNRSLAFRLTVWYAVTAFVLVAAATSIQYRVLATDLASEDDQLVLETLAAVQRGVPFPARADPADALIGPVVRVLDATCLPIAGTTILDGPPPACGALSAVAAPGRLGVPQLLTWHAPAGTQWRIVRQPLSSAASAAVGTKEARWVEVALNRYTDVSLLHHYRRELGGLLLATLLVAGGLGHLLARRGLQPLETLADTIALMDARALEAPIRQPDAPAEVRALAASFETMRSRLSAAFKALSHLSTELAHDLRTPLHILRQQAEVALRRPRSPQEYQDVLGSQLEELERLRRMVDDTLFLARAEDPRARIECDSLLAREELTAVAEFLDAFAMEYQVEVVVEAPRDLRVCADRLLLRRALVNLLTNALHHVPPGGRVTVAARADGDAVAIVVQDSGAGVPPELLPDVFDRYVRSNRVSAAASGNDTPGGQEPGTGLGLAIVRGIMSLHGGTATMESEIGQGAAVTLRFPELRPQVSASSSRPVKTVIFP